MQRYFSGSWFIPGLIYISKTYKFSVWESTNSLSLSALSEYVSTKSPDNYATYLLFIMIGVLKSSKLTQESVSRKKKILFLFIWSDFGKWIRQRIFQHPIILLIILLSLSVLLMWCRFSVCFLLCVMRLQDMIHYGCPQLSVLCSS